MPDPRRAHHRDVQHDVTHHPLVVRRRVLRHRTDRDRLQMQIAAVVLFPRPKHISRLQQPLAVAAFPPKWGALGVPPKRCSGTTPKRNTILTGPLGLNNMEDQQQEQAA
jgi:hypothetical protein